MGSPRGIDRSAAACHHSFGHRAAEELVEQRHGERSITMCGAEDHALGDETASARRDALDSDAELPCDVSRTVRAGTEGCHRP